MSYLVLARKWRPESFADVVGQKHVVLTLSAALRAERIAHAYLFAGPRGVGKTTVARILAKALNCDKGPTDKPCGKCASCLEIASGRSLDVIEIDGASNRKIEDARGIRETVQYAPLSGRMKVYIIDEAHMLTREAFNALLKTLEEPPPHVVFILATTEVGKIPDTITSRCQRFDFHRIAASEIEARLTEIAKVEGFNIGESAIRLVSTRADGSMRDAESLLDQLVSVGKDTITVDDVASVLGIPDIDVFFTISDAIARHDSAATLGALEVALDSGFDPRDLIDGVVDHLRNLLLVSMAPSPERVVGRIADYRSHEGESKALTEDDLVRLIRIGVDAQAASKWTTQPGLIVELALMRMAKLARAIDLEDVLRAIETGAAAASGREGGGGAAGGGAGGGAGAGRGVARKSAPARTGSSAGGSRSEPGTAPAGEPARSALAATGAEARPGGGTTAAATAVRDAAADGADGGESAPPGDVDVELWPDVLERIRTVKPALAAFLTEAVASAPRVGEVSLLVPNGSRFHKDQLRDRGNMRLMERAASEVFGGRVKLGLTFGSPPGGDRVGPGGQASPSMSSQIVGGTAAPAGDDPMVRKVLEFFDGEITSRDDKE